ncbi:MAG TPA: AMP-binding protein [Bryobacteraceae bacterium]
MDAYAQGPSLPLLDKTIPQVLEETIRRNPSGLALVSRQQNIRYSWQQLANETAHVAAGLWSLGIRPGDRVGIWASNCTEWILLQMATAQIGVLLVNVNPAYRSHELGFVLRKSGMKALFLLEKDARANYLEILEEARAGQKLPLEHVILLDHPSWFRFLDVSSTAPRVGIEPDDVVNIQYTSGTTGSPKGIQLTHRNLINNGYLVGYTLKNHSGRYPLRAGPHVPLLRMRHEFADVPGARHPARAAERELRCVGDAAGGRGGTLHRSLRRADDVHRGVGASRLLQIRPHVASYGHHGERGELCARGYMTMKGYDGEPQATAETIDAEGWVHTGDLATMRPDGYFQISGRLKDMIIRGGENIYPREIEEFLHQHPKIADVYVVGLPDMKLGEAVLAWIRLKSAVEMTEDEVREYCRGRIAHFKIPQYVRFVDSFPMTVTGKIRKFRIREIEIEERGLQAAASVRTA